MNYLAKNKNLTTLNYYFNLEIKTLVCLVLWVHSGPNM